MAGREDGPGQSSSRAVSMARLVLCGKFLEAIHLIVPGSRVWRVASLRSNERTRARGVAGARGLRAVDRLPMCARPRLQVKHRSDARLSFGNRRAMARAWLHSHRIDR